MDASRLFWTLKNYGHTGNILIVAGGLNELKEIGVEILSGEPTNKIAKYTAVSFNKDSIISMDNIESTIMTLLMALD